MNPSENPLDDTQTRFLEALQQDPQGIYYSWQEMQTEMQQMRTEMETLRNTATATAAEATTSQGATTNTPTSPHIPQPLDPQTMATIMAAVSASLSRTSDPKLPKSEKLPDTAEYEGDMDKLDAWEQALVQRMHGNADRYPTDEAKITYAESRLTIGKKAHNLMNRYRVNGLCTLTSFDDWRRKLRDVCGNRFEEEDARIYLRDTLKQGNMSFDEYYNFFVQKKERSGMEDASLIDAMKTNVNYSTQAAAIAWRKADGTLPTTFQDHVDMWSTVDWQQIPLPPRPLLNEPKLPR